MTPNGPENSGDHPTLTPPVRDRALAALERMGKPQPKPAGSPSGPASDSAADLSAGSGSATGFARTLAHDSFGAGGILAPASPDPADPPSRLIPMAREITPPAEPLPAVLPGSILAPTHDFPLSTSGAPAPAPPASRVVIALMSLFSLLLIAIGAWAAGALIYMARSTPFGPSDVHYPLLSWTYDAGPAGDFTAATRTMAWTMLLCLPVAAVILAITIKIARRKS